MSQASTTRNPTAARLLIFLLLLLGGLWSAAANAQARDCTLTLAPLSFGNYDPLETTVPVVSTSNLTLRCNRRTQVTVALSTGSSGTFTARTMRFGASILGYNIFGDSGFVFLWGDGTGGSFVRNVDVRRNRDVIVTMFGRIPPGQDPSVGPHSDTIIVTMTF